MTDTAFVLALAGRQGRAATSPAEPAGYLPDASSSRWPPPPPTPHGNQSPRQSASVHSALAGGAFPLARSSLALSSRTYQRGGVVGRPNICYAASYISGPVRTCGLLYPHFA